MYMFINKNHEESINQNQTKELIKLGDEALNQNQSKRLSLAKHHKHKCM